MQGSDCLAIALGVFFFGAGALMTTLTQRVIRIAGLSSILLGAVGLFVWFVYLRDALAEGPAINAPNNQGIVTQGQSGGTNIIDRGAPPPKPEIKTIVVAPEPNGLFRHQIAVHIESATPVGLVKIDPTEAGTTIQLTPSGSGGM